MNYGNIDLLFISASLVISAAIISVVHAFKPLDPRESGTYLNGNDFELRARFIQQFNAVLGVALGATGVLLSIFSEMILTGGPIFGYDGNFLCLVFLVLIFSLGGKEIAIYLGMGKFRKILVPQKRDVFKRIKNYVERKEGFTNDEIKKGLPTSFSGALMDLMFLNPPKNPDLKFRLEKLRPFFEEEDS